VARILQISPRTVRRDLKYATTLRRSEPHIHTIKDFKVCVPASAGHASISLGKLTGAVTKYNGTATVVMKGTPIHNVPISINIMGHVVSLWIDPSKVMNHFGNTPIYRFVRSATYR
jgi:hypothetical protein